MRITRTHLGGTYKTKRIYGGVYIDQDQQIHFNWNSDDKHKDVLSLAESSSGTYDDDGVEYIYGYRYNDHASTKHAATFRNYIKNAYEEGHLFDEDIEEFVENAVNELDAHHRIKDFSAMITTKSSAPLSVLHILEQYLHEQYRNIEFSFQLLKQMYKDVTFDIEEAKVALKELGYSDAKIESELEFTLNKFEKLKQSRQLFQMKRFVPKEIRASFHNFLKFATEEERQIYESLQGVDVLIYDDFLTSGATVREIIRYLRSINDNNRLTVFVLVKQH